MVDLLHEDRQRPLQAKVIPGDTVLFRLKLASPIRRGLVHMTGEAFVGDKLVSQAEMLAQIIQDRVSSSTSA